MHLLPVHFGQTTFDFKNHKQRQTLACKRIKKTTKYHQLRRKILPTNQKENKIYRKERQTPLLISHRHLHNQLLNPVIPASQGAHQHSCSRLRIFFPPQSPLHLSSPQEKNIPCSIPSTSHPSPSLLSTRSSFSVFLLVKPM